MPDPDAPGTARRHRMFGILLLSLSTLVFSCGNTLAKYLTGTYPIGEALAVRAGFGLLLLLPFVRPGRVLAEARAGARLHLTRMVLAGFEIACFYLAVAVLPLADVSTFYLASPILLTALSAAALGERVDPPRWAAALVGFAGVVVALRPTGEALSWPSLIALAGATLYAIYLAVTRHLRATNGRVLVVLQLLALWLSGMVTLPFGWTLPDGNGLLLMAAVGLFGIGGYFCVNTALQLAPASVVAPFQYLSILWAVLWGWLVFGDLPDAAMLLGGGLIVAAGGFILYRERVDAVAGRVR